MTNNDGPATPARTPARHGARAAGASSASGTAAPRARKAAAVSAAAPIAPQPLSDAAGPPAKPKHMSTRGAVRVPRVRQACRLTPAEYEALGRLKKRAAALARPTKRGGLLRAGLHALCRMDDVQLFALLDSLPDPDAATA